MAEVIPRESSEQLSVALFQVLFQLRLMGKNPIQTAIQARVVDLAFWDFQQVIQRGGRIPALLDRQLTAWRAQAIDRQQCG